MSANLHAAFALQDVLNIESENGSTHEDNLKSMQRAVNSGAAWTLQGAYGRAAMQAITEGSLMLGLVETRDAYGHIVPSRFQVQEGTKGSRKYVVDRHGEDLAKLLEDL